MSRCKRSLLKRLRSIAASNGKRRRRQASRTERTNAKRNRARQRRGRALLNPGQGLPEMSPVERRPRVGLAAGCNVEVPNDIDDRISPAQNHEKFRQARVLSSGVSLVVGAFELHAHRKIVTALAPPPDRRAGVPGSLCARHQLDQFTPAPYRSEEHTSEL